MSLPSGTPIGKYLVRRKLAEGGMAEIYLCSSRGPEGFEKDVVIKRVRSTAAHDPDFVKMFVAEAQLVSKLNHANIVQIFDFEKHQDTYYLAMEYVRGHSIWEVRKRCRELMVRMPPTLVAHIGSEVARGLHYAHCRSLNGQPLRIVHRDVSPHNILLSFDGAVKLTDFGIAKAGARMSSPGLLKGKFAYMSPEQSRGHRVDARSDVFALGIVLWELLTGGRLFDADNDAAMLRAVRHSIIPSPARINADVTSELDAIVSKTLERDVKKRFQTALQLERALAQYVLGQARIVEDVDVALFLRRIFPEEATGAAQVEKLPSVSVSIETPVDVETGGVDPHEANTLPERNDFRGCSIEEKPSRNRRRQWRLPLVLTAAGLPVGVAVCFLVIVGSSKHAPEAEAQPDSSELVEGGVAPLRGSLVVVDSQPARGLSDVDSQPISGLPDLDSHPAEEGMDLEKTVPARRRPGLGSLVIHATPYATVFVDEKKVGDADPRATFRVSAGRHRLRLIYKTTVYETDVDLRSGEAKIIRNFLPRP